MTIGELRAELAKYDDDQYVSVMTYSHEWARHFGNGRQQNPIEKVQPYKPWHEGPKDLVGIYVWAGDGK